ncbi:uncharacterized protein LOC101848574 [Aplysia californica]|uniref:Uncharacterized protein LOC101848574 n=1 Tax=Aplysia californica TaxID=6500 RepID=A0ABM0JGU7_APLCA|nr:uncharacterized protein LOC101848574 [Aplysia californica]
MKRFLCVVKKDKGRSKKSKAELKENNSMGAKSNARQLAKDASDCSSEAGREPQNNHVASYPRGHMACGSSIVQRRRSDGLTTARNGVASVPPGGNRHRLSSIKEDNGVHRDEPKDNVCCQEDKWSLDYPKVVCQQGGGDREMQSKGSSTTVSSEPFLSWQTQPGCHEILLSPPISSSNFHGVAIYCKKKTDHRKYYPVRSVTKENFPPEFADDDIVELFLLRAKLTVRLLANYVSRNRPDGYTLASERDKTTHDYRYFSGWLSDHLGSDCSFDMPCPLDNCPFPQPHTVTGPFYIYTVAHGIFDTSEACKTIIEFFYDDATRPDTILRAEGYKLMWKNKHHDICKVACVSHDPKLAPCLTVIDRDISKVSKRLKLKTFPGTLVAIISHPHGYEKHISFCQDLVGQLVREHADDRGFYHFRYKAATCDSCSGAPVYILHPSCPRLAVAPHSRWLKQEELNKSGMVIGTFHP